MIDFIFPEIPKSLAQIETIQLPAFGQEKRDDEWIYKRYDIILRITCADGVFLVVIRKDY